MKNPNKFGEAIRKRQLADKAQKSKITYPGKFNNKLPKPVPVVDTEMDKMQSAKRRLEKGDYTSVKNGYKIQDFAKKQEDAVLVKKLNKHNAKQAHEAAGKGVGSWVSEKKASEDYGMLPTTLQRLSHAGHLLFHADSRSYSAPSIEAYLNSVM